MSGKRAGTGTRSYAIDVAQPFERVPLAEWEQRYPGFRPAGVLCSYVPGEMLHAAGLTPVRLRTSAAPLRQADAHLQSFTCALCRSALDQALDGGLAPLAGTVFAHTCDAMQALADLWRMRMGPGHFVHAFMHPAHLSTPAARPYLAAELERLRQALSAFTGRPIEEDDLRASIALLDETRRLVAALGERRERLSALEFYGIVDAAQAMPREIFNPRLAALLARLDDATAPPDTRWARSPTEPSPPRLFLAGALLDEPRVLELIEQLGARVAGDDLCSGARAFDGQVAPGPGEGAIDVLARYLLERAPCPTKYRPGHDPAAHLLEGARRARADGVVSILNKFCEPHAFDYALVRPALDGAGLPHLVLEMEQTPSIEAIRTRLQAFIEML